MEALLQSPLVAGEAAVGNPFVGLRSFDTRDSCRFFGRREQVSELLQKLYSTRFLGVVGSSGCGKSSLVRAGLIPKLQAGFLVAERDSWLQVEMRPGYQPIVSLAAALREAAGTAARAFETAALARAIRQSRTRFVIELLQPALAENKNVFLLVDQFEEIFRYELLKDPDTREESLAFVSILLALTQRGQLPIYTAMTMRSEFIGECDVFPGLPEVLNQSLYLVPRLTRQQRREAIEGPIWLQSAAIAPRLVDLLLNDSDSQPDQLPVLQHALMRTWEEWSVQLGRGDERAPVDVEHYKLAGGLSGALNNDANAAFEALGEAARDLARRMFKALTETDSANRQVRHPARLSELQEITGAGRAAIEHVIEVFNSSGRCFLVVSGEAQDVDPMIDICHESLIRQWKKLGKWVEEAAEFAAVYRRLEEDAFRYSKEEAVLLSGPQLQRALRLWETERPSSAWACRTRKSQLFKSESQPSVALAPSLEEVERFLYESRDERARKQQSIQEERDREERRIREQGLAHEKAKRIRVVGWLVAVLLITTLVMWLKSLVEIKVAKPIFRAMEVTSMRPQLGLMLGIKGLRFAESARLEHDAEVSEAFLRQAVRDIGGQRLGALDGAVLSVAVDPDSHFLFSVSSFGTVLRRDLRVLTTPPSQLWPLPGIPEAGEITLVAVGGSNVAIAGKDGLVHLVNQKSGQPPRTLPLIEPQQRQAISALALSPDDCWLVAGDERGNIAKWDLKHDGWELIRRGARQKQFGQKQPTPDQPVLMARISKGGRLLTRDSAGLVTVWRLDESAWPPFEVREAEAADLSADGQLLYVIVKGYIKRLNLEQRTVQILSTVGNVSASTLRISPDNQWLVAIPKDWTSPLLWSVPPPSEKDEFLRSFPTLHGHDGPVNALDFSPDGHWLVTGGALEDGSLRLWDLTTPDPTSSTVLHRTRQRYTSTADLTPDARWLATGDESGVTYVWDLHSASATPIKLSPDAAYSGTRVKRVKLSSNGYWLMIKSEVQRVPTSRPQLQTELWDLRSQKKPERAQLAAITHEDNIIDFSPDGMSAIVAPPGELRLLPLMGQGQVITVNMPQSVKSPLNGIVLSPDLRHLVASDALNDLWLCDLHTPRANYCQALGKAAEPHSADVPVSAMAFSGDSQWFAAGRNNGRARAWRVSEGKVHDAVFLNGHLLQINAIVFIGNESEKKRRVITASADGTARLFSFERSKTVPAEVMKVFEGNEGPILSAWVNKNGTKLVTGGSDGAARIWSLDRLEDSPSIVSGGDGPITTGTFDSSERFITTMSLDGTVRRWSLDRDALVRQVGEIVWRSLTPLEKAEYSPGLRSWWRLLTSGN